MSGPPPRLLNAEHANAFDAVVVMDREGRIREWSDRAEEVFGWKRSEALGRLVASLLIPDRFREAFVKSLKRLGPLDPDDAPREFEGLETFCLHRNGAELHTQFQITGLVLDQSIYYLALVRNLTEFRARERDTSSRVMESRLLQQMAALTSGQDTLDESLAKSLDSLARMTNSPLGFVLRPDRRQQEFRSSKIYCDENDSRLQGLEAQRPEIRANAEHPLLGAISRAVGPIWVSDFSQINSLLPKAWQDLGFEGACGFPVVIDDETAAILVFFSWLSAEQDRQTMLLINNFRQKIGLAIERRRWIEERARLAAIVESSYDAIIARDVQGKIIAWNSGAEQIYGFAAEEALGKSIDLVLPPELQEEETPIRDVLRTGQRLKLFDAKRQCKNGTLIEVALTVSPIRDSRGRVVGISSIERDVTAQKKREKELRKAKRDAERADQAKSEFLANISHELRTPMNAILGMLKLGLGEEISDLMRDYLTTAYESADTLLHLLNDLLDFSRISGGHLDLENEPFHLRETLDAAMKTLSQKASEKGLELACHVDPDVPDRLEGDGMRLRQIIVNLTGNALKFTEQGEVIVKANVKSRTEGGVVLQIGVRDTGIGISPEDQRRIFAPFTQVDASTTRSETGSGLGLSIVRELVGKMGGTIGVESELGRGSLFYFSIPYVVLPEESQENQGLELEDLPVLVVDDNRTNQLILEETLSNWSMRPTVAANARQAIDLLQEAESRGEPFPLIIVDALMPDMDGFKLVEHLNEQLESNEKPVTVLMLSSADRQTFKQRCQELEVSAYLDKPVSQSELLDTLMTALKGPMLDRNSYEKIQETPQSMKILVAEDTPANQKVVRAILEKRGHEVEIANNGREAVDEIQQGSFDVVLMDVQMPTMDGLQATNAIRGSSRLEIADVPIVAMTAHARREDRQKCLAAGMDAYLAKPIDAQRLVELVESVRHRANLLRASETWQGEPVSVPGDDGKIFRHINLESAKARMGGDEGLVVDLAELFLQDGPELLAETEKALKEKQHATVERAAHSLKGLAANFDAETLATVAMSVEDHGRNDELDQAAERFVDLRRALRAVVKELQLYLQGKGAG